MFFVSQFEADASGVLAVVTFGVIISAVGKSSATGEAGKFMEVVWEQIEWIANTVNPFFSEACPRLGVSPCSGTQYGHTYLDIRFQGPDIMATAVNESLGEQVIFFLAGAITADITVSRATKSNDFGYLLLVYVLVYVIRFIMLGFFYPILRRVGYGTSIPEVAVIGHGGLRGAVGLALALSFAESSSITDKVSLGT